MEISGSAFNSGLAAIQSGQQRVDQAATNIASSTVTRPEQARDSTALPDTNADLASSLVELKVGKTEAQAGAKVVETADEVLGTLLDIRA